MSHFSLCMYEKQYWLENLTVDGAKSNITTILLLEGLK